MSAIICRLTFQTVYKYEEVRFDRHIVFIWRARDGLRILRQKDGGQEMKHEELTLEKECRRLARLSGWVAVKLEKNGHKGIPDDLFLHPDGRWRLVEFKKDAKQHARPEQVVWLDKFPDNSRLISSLSDFRKFFGIDG